MTQSIETEAAVSEVALSESASSANDELTTSDALIGALQEAGVSVIFANLGSDHPGVIEALARARERGERVPAVVLCPHESTAMSAAHGYALASGQTQAVFVHTDVGTANLGGSVHNAARSRVPVFILAGLTPYTLEGELPGTRNSYVNHLQDVHDQHSILRPYVKWSYDVRTGSNIKQLVFRALQIAGSSPGGPVYLTAAREVLAQHVPTRALPIERWRPIAPAAPAGLAEELIRAIATARFPLLITSHLGRSPAAVGKLTRLVEALGIGVIETTPSAMNFAPDHPLHLGYTVNELLPLADLIIAIDTDSPWILSQCTPAEGSRVFFIDPDPLKEDLPLWYLEADHFIRADSEAVLDQLLDILSPDVERAVVDAGSDAVIAAADRVNQFTVIHDKQREDWATRLEKSSTSLSPESVCAAIDRLIDDETIVLNEAITNSGLIARYVPRTKPGTMFSNGGTSLGWSGGAAIGFKLARPDKTVVNIVGDGTYFLSVPSSTYWVAQHYAAPMLTVIFDNGGWNATKQNLIRQHPTGIANTADRYWVNLGQSADLPGIATAAGDAFGVTVSSLAELEPALATALSRVKGGQAAVVNVRLPVISRQPDDTVTTQ